MSTERALTINPRAVYASDELVFSRAVSASIAVGPLPFKVTYPTHNHVSGKIRHVMRRTSGSRSEAEWRSLRQRA